MLSFTQPRGFTLIELMIAMAIAVLLLLLAAPMYSVWLADSQIRNAAESIAGGMRFAQAAAVKRNRPVEFVLDKTTATGSWTARLPAVDADLAEDLEVGVFAEGAVRVDFDPRPTAATTVTFSPLGRIVPNAGGTTTLTEVRVTIPPPPTGTRPLRVLVGGARTGIKICDPAWPATDPKGCPP